MTLCNIFLFVIIWYSATCGKDIHCPSVPHDYPKEHCIYRSQAETEMSSTAGGGDVLYSWRWRCLVQSGTEISRLAGDRDVSYGQR